MILHGGAARVQYHLTMQISVQYDDIVQVPSFVVIGDTLTFSYIPNIQACRISDLLDKISKFIFCSVATEQN